MSTPDHQHGSPGADDADVVHTIDPQRQIKPETRVAMEALLQYGGARRYYLTQLEVEMWLVFIERVDAAAFQRFLSSWGLREKFMPTIPDAAKALGIIASPEQVFEETVRAIASIGPYNSPEFADPVARQAIVLLGGWARFCEEVPDPNWRDDAGRSNEFAFGQYRKRFLEAYAQAQSQVAVQGVAAPALLGLADLARARPALAAPTTAARLGHAGSSSSPNPRG